MRKLTLKGVVLSFLFLQRAICTQPGHPEHTVRAMHAMDSEGIILSTMLAIHGAGVRGYMWVHLELTDVGVLRDYRRRCD